MTKSRHSSGRRSSSRRRGAVIVLIAGGMITLLAFAALTVDVNYWLYEKNRLENVTYAAARAGYTRLRELDFNYRNPETRDQVDATIREYLVLNGTSREEADSATITVDKVNRISVTVLEVSGAFFAPVVNENLRTVRIAGKGRVAQANNLAPFAIPARYHDPDHDLQPNVIRSNDDTNGRIGANTGAYKNHQPYVIKFGRPLFRAQDDFILIPMDRVDSNIPPAAFANMDVPSQKGGKVRKFYGGIHIPAQHMDTKDLYNVGVFRAYGAAYKVLGVPKIKGDPSAVNWLLGFCGGSFLIKEKFLTAAGFTYHDDGSGAGTLSEKGKATNLRAMRLVLSDPSHPSFLRDYCLMRYINHVLQGKKKSWIKPLMLFEQPQVCTFTGSADPCTRAMDFAGLPYVAVNDLWNPRLDENGKSSCVAAYKLTSLFPKALDSPDDFFQFLQNAPNAKGDKGFDWLHIHHEDFTDEGRFPPDKHAIIEGIRLFVRKGHHHLFAACLAIETLEIFLAESVFGPSPAGLVKEMLDFDNTFGCRHFDLDKSRGGMNKVGTFSSIDGETSGDEHRWFMTDYLNPRCQNHDGFGGVRLDISAYPPRLTPASTASDRRMVAPEGSTNTVLRRYLKPYQIPEHDGLEVTAVSRPILVLGPVGDPTQGVRKWKGDRVRYMAGVADDDDNLKNGHGEFTYLGGHTPCDMDGAYHCVGDLVEGCYYDDDDTWFPETLTRERGRKTQVLKIDWDEDQKVEGFQNFKKLDRQLKHEKKGRPKSVDPTATTSMGWPTLPGTELHSIDDPRSRWVASTGQANYNEPPLSSASMVYDIDNDGVSSSRFLNGLFIRNTPNVPGYRLYLNNILYGATSLKRPDEEKYNLGAVNPGKMSLGEKLDQYGTLKTTGGANSFVEMMQYGYSSKKGLPVGSIFQTAPGDFEKQVDQALGFNFKNEHGESEAVTWTDYMKGAKAGPGQIKVVPVTEVVGDASRSMYAGTEPQKIRVIGYAKFFVIDNSKDRATHTRDSKSPNYLGGPPLPGEIRGYFLEWVCKPTRGL